MQGPPHREPHGVEADGLDQLEVPAFQSEARSTFRGSLQSIAKVDPTPQYHAF
jgi:hypothetical protein